MKVICNATECEYYDNGECGIVKDGLDTLEITEDGECACFEYAQEGVNE